MFRFSTGEWFIPTPTGVLLPQYEGQTPSARYRVQAEMQSGTTADSGGVLFGSTTDEKESE